MEKQRINRASRFIKGLLALLLLTTTCFSQLFSEEDKIIFRAIENQELITESEVMFQIDIPHINSSEITILEDLNQLRGKSNVSFLSLKKYDNPLGDGTIIKISYLFERKGEYTLEPLIADVQGVTRKMEFETVEISNNPSKMIPTLVIKFSNGKTVNSEDLSINKSLFTHYVNEELNFTVYLQYATQLNHFNYEIPENSIYAETKTYDITNKGYKISSVSDELTPVASFQWTILKEGSTSLPFFKVAAEGYDGRNYDITLPDIKINVVSKKANTDNSSSSSINAFNDSFLEIEDEEIKEKREVSVKDYEKLASLYSKENNAIFTYSKAKKERIAFEEELGLSSFYKTFPLLYLYLSIFLIIVFTVLLFFVIRKKHFFKTITLSLLLLSSIAFLIFTIGRRSKEYGISKGCTIYSIPERTAEISYEIKKGSVVLVTETTDIWYHIQQGEASGWSLKDNIIIIK